MHLSIVILIFQGVEFKLEIKNLAMSDSKGHDLEKDIAVRVTSVESMQVNSLSSFDLITDKAAFFLWICLTHKSSKKNVNSE